MRQAACTSHPTIARLGDLHAPVCLAGAPLAGHQPHVALDLVGIAEALHVVDGNEECDGRHWPHARGAAPSRRFRIATRTTVEARSYLSIPAHRSATFRPLMST